MSRDRKYYCVYIMGSLSGTLYKALAREKQLKGWTRAKKIALIVRQNPHWLDLARDWYPWMRSEESRDASTPQ